MRPWLRRFVYLLVVLAWLVVMSLPVLAFVLATQGELRLGNDVRRNTRLFLVLEEEAQGLGIQWTRPVSRQSQCARTSLRYFFWEGSSEGQNVNYCQCYDASGAPLSGRSCPP
ncbi:MAG: hypothetical protein L0332_26335 [Chloroflexi bacterium]|nr:hypothetical protein [Chloroflexota bacterium]MCI0580049.1 hypothetical protein [Chloroflexota bacterium]MCI0649759.1 hypothetical protein [Chloroflexota bacterium]MCI0730216.1 hypothetical protein [Chloroflexota bacterium]